MGLFNPATTILQADGTSRTFTPTATQEWIWQLYLEDVARVKAVAGGRPIVLLLLGDLIHGNRHMNQLMSTCHSDQEEIAIWALKPWYNLGNLESVRICLGTEAHNFGEGSAEKSIARRLAEKYPKVSTKAIGHGLVTIRGHLIDYAHHGVGAGSRRHTRGNSMRSYARSIVDDCLELGLGVPRIIVRGHYHDFQYETVRTRRHTVEVVNLPSYCGMGEFGRKATRSAFIHQVGLVYAEVTTERIVMHTDRIHVRDIRYKEEL
jgi:hypothetical protein